MALTRLENFIKNVEGNILYVNPNDLDASDSILNQGNSLTRPFKSIQRALIEAARFSYLVGSNNDKFDKTTIIVYPGEYVIDNRPGYTVYDNSGSAVFENVNGNVVASYLPSGLTDTSNFNLLEDDNVLYTFNSSSGGVIIPRGTSIVGLDLRKTKIRPLFVPDPTNDTIERTSIFKITGACYFSQFTLFDANPNGFCYKNYTTERHSPVFSHHKLNCFEYADGINKIGDTDLTDLQMYYYKVAQAYGIDSGRSIEDFPTTTDFEPKVDEYRIVAEVTTSDLTIGSIQSGDGVSPSQTITITTVTEHNLQVDTPIRITGVAEDAAIYNGSFVVTAVISETEFQYLATSTPSVILPTVGSAKVMIESDSVSSASPYLFSCTLRSVYGMCGILADGSKATGFKSMVVAQFTGVSLQKDDNAFVKYVDGIYRTQTQLGSTYSLHTDQDAIYKPEYYNYHIKTANGAYIQAVSVFAIGFSQHFVAESGGDQSITNSNSNFGSLSLKSEGFRSESFDRDDVGYITHIIPPKEDLPSEKNIPWLSLDTSAIINAGVGNTEKLYLDGFTDPDIAPPANVESYKVGAKVSDLLYINLTSSGITSTYSAPIIMEGTGSVSFEKSFNVQRSGSLNQILSNETLVLTDTHNFTTGEKVVVFAENGDVPDGLLPETIYYVVSVGSTTLRLAETFNNATATSPIFINTIQNNGGKLRIVSRVSDKSPGEYGHPVQFDSTNNKWYLKSTSTNSIRSAMVSIGVTSISLQSPTSYLKRREDNRSLPDRTYRVRFVIPKEATSAKAPNDGFILQESGTVLEDTTSVLSSAAQLRNTKVIAEGSWSSNVATLRLETPHKFLVGDSVKVTNVTSGINTTGEYNLGYNGLFTVVSVPTPKTFTYALTTDPGLFTNDVSVRNSSLPTASRNKLSEIFHIFRSETIQSHVASKRDGIYHLTLIKSSVSPTATQFEDSNYNQPIRYLYPSQDRDNYNSDPKSAKTVAVNSIIGKTVLDDIRSSITKESLNDLLKSTNIAIGITNIVSTGTTATAYTEYVHGLNPATGLTLVSGGTGYATTNRNVLLTSDSGQGLSINVTSTSGGAITGWDIVDGGANYTVGTAVTAYGVGGADASFVISSIRNDVGKVIQVTGVTTTGFGGESNAYNGNFRITSVDNLKEFSYQISTSLGVGSTSYSSGGQFYVCDSSVAITSIVYNSTTGIATVSTGSTSHGLLVSNRFNIVGSSQTQYNGSYLVESRVGLNTFTFYLGTGLTLPAYGGNSYILKGVISSYGEDTSLSDENIGNRLIPIYANQTTHLTSLITASTTSVGVSTIGDLRKGDYVQIDEEIVRISTTPSGSSISVLRGVLGTIAVSHSSETEVKKVRVVPIELRRPSFIRASNHTFEYMGFGPGNYSTALPQRQSKILSKEEQLLAQKKSESGGIVVYTGMNDSGDFYIGNQRLSSNTAQEETLDAPIFEYYGDPRSERKLSAIFDDVIIRDRIKIDGGSGNILRSEFNGPVLLSNKTTSTSTIEARTLAVKGDSDNPSSITVSTQTPTTTGQGGDIVLRDSPTSGTSAGSFLGWVWTDSWKRFAPISTSRDSFTLLVDKIGIGVTQTDIAIRTIGQCQLGPTVVSTIDVAGIATFRDPVEFSSVFVATNLIVNDSVLVNSGITTLKLTGITTANIGIASVGFSTITSAIIGIATVGLQTVTTDLNVGGNLQVAGLSTFIGNVTFGGGTIGLGDDSGDTISVVGEFVSNLIPFADLTYDVGSGSKRWRNVRAGFASVTDSILGVSTVGFATITGAYIGVSTIGSSNITNATVGVATVGLQTVTTDLSVGSNLQVAGLSTFTGNSVFSGDVTLGDSSSDNVVFNADINSNIIPNTSSLDLGSSSAAWRNLYVGFTSSTNIFAGVVTSTVLNVSNFTVSGVSTFNNTVLIPSSNLGINVANPTSKLDVGGDGNFTGVVTATTFNGQVSSGVGTITTLSGTTVTYTTGNITTVNSTTGNIVTGVVTDISGSNLTYSGVSTFTNGPVLVGVGTTTGTSLQPLQVTGGAYVSGNLGVGSTNPARKLDVVGDARITGFATITNAYVGVGTIATLVVTNGITVGSVVDTTTLTVAVNGTSKTSIAYPFASSYRVAKYDILATRGSDHQFIQLTAIHNGTTAYATQVNEISTANPLGIFDVNIGGSFFNLEVTNQNSGITTYRISATLYKPI